MMPFIAIILLAISLLFAGGQQFTAQNYGGAVMEYRTADRTNKVIPPVDLKVPAVTETATFALG